MASLNQNYLIFLLLFRPAYIQGLSSGGSNKTQTSTNPTLGLDLRVRNTLTHWECGSLSQSYIGIAINPGDSFTYEMREIAICRWAKR